MVCKMLSLVFVTIISVALGQPNKTTGYFEYKYSMQGDLLIKKEKEFSGCCPPLSQVNPQLFVQHFTKQYQNDHHYTLSRQR